MFKLYKRVLLLSCVLLSACSPKKAGEFELWTPLNRSSKSSITIWIDPGHGGMDPGASNKRLKLQEKAICLKTAQLVQKKLSAMGYRARLLRQKDEYISLEKRVKLANTERNSVMVSIHFNSARNVAANGIEVYYFSPGRGASLRHQLSHALAIKIEKKTVHYTGATSRGAKIGSFRVIRSTAMPSCLIEGGFLTNPKEAQKLSQNSYIDQLAKGIAEGVDAFCLEYSSKIKNLKNRSALN